jgi:hypothetical protein
VEPSPTLPAKPLPSLIGFKPATLSGDATSPAEMTATTAAGNESAVDMNGQENGLVKNLNNNFFFLIQTAVNANRYAHRWRRRLVGTIRLSADKCNCAPSTTVQVQHVEVSIL